MQVRFRLFFDKIFNVGGRLVSKILGFESEDEGAIPSRSKIISNSNLKYKINLMVFGIQKVFSLVKLLKKKNKKILVSLYTTVNYLNQTLQKKKNFFFCFIAKNFLCIVLKILQKIGVILA